jgi:hypothetical protein
MLMAAARVSHRRAPAIMAGENGNGICIENKLASQAAAGVKLAKTAAGVAWRHVAYQRGEWRLSWRTGISAWWHRKSCNVAGESASMNNDDAGISKASAAAWRQRKRRHGAKNNEISSRNDGSGAASGRHSEKKIMAAIMKSGGVASMK